MHIIFYQVNPDCLRPHVSDLLQALVCCFKDDSWPVRDGKFCSLGNKMKIKVTGVIIRDFTRNS